MQYWLAPFELIIIDNIASGKYEALVKRTQPYLKKHGSSIRLYQFEEPKSFSIGNNYALSKAQHEQIFIINPDCKFIDFSVFQWVQENPLSIKSQLIYPKLLNSDGTVQQSYNEWPNILNQLNRLLRAKLGLSTAQKQTRKDWFFASAIITTKSIFYKLKGFDERFPLYCEDVDLCYKAQLLSVPCNYVEDVQMIHHLGGEAKHKYLYKAILSNIIWRYVKVRNYMSIKLLGRI